MRGIIANPAFDVVHANRLADVGLSQPIEIVQMITPELGHTLCAPINTVGTYRPPDTNEVEAMVFPPELRRTRRTLHVEMNFAKGHTRRVPGRSRQTQDTSPEQSPELFRLEVLQCAPVQEHRDASCALPSMVASWGLSADVHRLVPYETRPR